MALDPSIALQAKPIQVSDPLDLAMTGAKLQEMRTTQEERQVDLQTRQRALQDDTDIRQAASQSTIKDPTTGMPTLDRQGMLQKLAVINPIAAQKQSMAFRTQDAEKYKMDREMKMNLAHSVFDQQSYDNAINKLATFDPNGAKAVRNLLGDIYVKDPDSQFQKDLTNFKNSTLDAHEQATIWHQQAQLNETQQNRAAENARAAAEIKSKESLAGLQRGMEAKKIEEVEKPKIGIEQTGQAIKLAEMQKQQAQFEKTKSQEADMGFQKEWAGRSAANDVQQSRADRLQAQKFNTILDPYVNPKPNDPRFASRADIPKNFASLPLEKRLNYATTTDVNLGFEELGKLAKGGAMTKEEFSHIVPDTSQKRIDTLWQNLISGKLEKADSGSFLIAGKNYAEDLDTKAKARIKNAYLTTLHGMAHLMSPTAVKYHETAGLAGELSQGSQYVPEMEKEKQIAEQTAKTGTPEEHDKMLAYARSPGGDAGVRETKARILRMHGFDDEAQDVLKGRPKAAR